MTVFAAAALMVASARFPAQIPGAAETRNIDVRGVVRDADSGRVLPRTNIRIGNTSSASDVDGRFILTGIAPGKQFLTANRAGYLLAGIHQPQPSQTPVYHDPGIYVSIPPDKPFEIVIYMHPSPTISGSVVDMAGLPVEGVPIMAFRSTYDGDGNRTFLRGRAGSFSGTTDDRGEFVLDSVVPGEYLLRVAPELTRKVVIPTYYPGTLDFSNADTVLVRSGEDVRLRPFVLQNAPSLWVTAHVLDQAGDEVPLPRLSVRRKGEPGDLASRTIIAGSLMKLPPGLYDVEAAAMSVGVTERSIVVARVARSSFEIRDADVTLSITLPAGTKTSIQVQQDKAGELIPVPGVPIRLIPRDFFSVQPFNATSGADGSLTISSMPAGSYRLTSPLYSQTEEKTPNDSRTVASAPMNLCIAEIRENNAAITGEDVKIAATSTAVSVILRESTTLIQGKAVDSMGVPNPNALVTLVPEDSKQPRGYASTAADQDGNFEFKCVPPGAYRLYAWTALPGAAYRNQDFMAKYRASGTAVRVAPGSRSTVQARVIE